MTAHTLSPVPGDEIQHGAIEGFGLFPIDRVSGFRHDHQFAVRDPGGDHARDRRRRRQVGIARDHERRHRELAQFRLGDPVCQRLARAVADLGLALELDPEAEAVRIGGAVGRA